MTEVAALSEARTWCSFVAAGSGEAGAVGGHNFNFKNHRRQRAGLHAAEWVDSERAAIMKAHRNFLLAVALAAAAAGTPAVGQKALPAVPASTVTQGAAVPDFSGIWAHLTWLTSSRRWPVRPGEELDAPERRS